MSGGTVLLLQLLLVLGGCLIACAAIVKLGSWRRLWQCLAVLLVFAAGGLYAYSQRAEPARTACDLPQNAGELGAICGVENPEDLEYSRAFNLILTAEFKPGGRLMGLRVDDLAAGPVALWPSPTADTVSAAQPQGDPTCTEPPAPERFIAHGLSVLDPTNGGPVRVAVVAHREHNDRIEWFDVTAAPTLHATWGGCVELPEHTRGNDVVLLADGSLVATNMAPEIFGSTGGHYIRIGLIGITTGDVMRWSRQDGWTHLTGTSGAIPNGIVGTPAGDRFYFADGGGRRVGIIDQPGANDVPRIERVRIDGSPDNVTLTSRGTVLAAIATAGGDVPIICGIGGRVCRSGWRVVELDPHTHASARIIEQDARIVASVTTALEVGNRIFVGTMADERIGVYLRSAEIKN